MYNLTNEQIKKLEKELGEDWIEYIVFDNSDDDNGYLVDQKNKLNGGYKMKNFEDLRIETSLKMLFEEYATFPQGETCNWSKFARNLLSDDTIKEAFIKKVINLKETL